jgi:hypothetical protein
LLYPTSVEFITNTLQGIFPLTVPVISRDVNYRAFKHFDFVAKPNQINVKLAERLFANALRGLYGFHASLQQPMLPQLSQPNAPGFIWNKNSHQDVRYLLLSSALV